jgi:histidinol dehydrogenase
MKSWKSTDLPSDWFKRGKTDEKDGATVEKTVKNVIKAVRKRGDAAVLELTKKFDETKLNVKDMRVNNKEIEAAYKAVTPDQVTALKFIKEKLQAREQPILEQQRFKTISEGITVETALRPIESVGCYVPGGQAPYPSTVVMTVALAKVAGVPRIVVCSPPTEKGTINPLILVASDLCGVDEVYKVGGAQAIAALAYGTETIKPVRKIFGPGSKFVTAAKISVSRDLAIDMPAGPSEVLILADESADPKLVAADMISQAEHGADSVAGLVTTSEKLADEVKNWLVKLANTAERKEIVKESLSKNGFIIVCEETREMAALANVFAPEHLEIVTTKAAEIAEQVTTAGLILLGQFSPVALSDYASGTDHVLPTGGYGYAFSGLSVLDFTRRVSIVESSKDGLKKAKPIIKVLTEAERLPNHYRAVESRFEK